MREKMCFLSLIIQLRILIPFPSNSCNTYKETCTRCSRAHQEIVVFELSFSMNLMWSHISTFHAFEIIYDDRFTIITTDVQNIF